MTTPSERDQRRRMVGGCDCLSNVHAECLNAFRAEAHGQGQEYVEATLDERISTARREGAEAERRRCEEAVGRVELWLASEAKGYEAISERMADRCAAKKLGAYMARDAIRSLSPTPEGPKRCDGDGLIWPYADDAHPCESTTGCHEVEPETCDGKGWHGCHCGKTQCENGGSWPCESKSGCHREGR